MQLNKFLLFPLLLVFMLSACGTEEVPQGTEGKDSSYHASTRSTGETATKGEIWIAADETLEPIVSQWLDIWHLRHQDSKIEVRYLPGEAAIRNMLRDSARIAIVGRGLTEQERKVLASQDNTKGRESLLATGGVALVVHKGLPIDSLSQAQVAQILRGEATRWDQLVPGAPAKPITALFDHADSGILHDMNRRFDLGGKVKGRVEIAGGIDSLFARVRQNPYAMGFAPEAFVIDTDDSFVRSRLDSLKLIRLDAPADSDYEGEYSRPFATELALGIYPFTRPITAINRENFQGLGTGFVIFLKGEIGQRIALKAGLAPAETPSRKVRFSD